MIKHPVSYLTSNYRKDKDSNNYKLLSIGHEEHTEIYKNLKEIESVRDIDEAFGFNLDKTGKNVLELRNDRDDEAYRRAIKIKIRGNLSAGTIEDINAICEILFEDNFRDVKETWNEVWYEHEPAALVISISDDPDAQNLIFEYLSLLVMEIKAGGVRLHNVIHTEISESILYTDTHVAADISYETIPTKSLKNMHFQRNLYIGTATCSQEYITIPTKPLRM